jgi:hypothetical protein
LVCAWAKWPLQNKQKCSRVYRQGDIQTQAIKPLNSTSLHKLGQVELTLQREKKITEYIRANSALHEESDGFRLRESWLVKSAVLH